MCPELPDSLRVVPDDWLGPLRTEAFFAPGRPLEVDVGCGKGRFLLARAARHPESDFLGIDRMLRRIRKVDRKALRAGLLNVRLLRVEAYYAVCYLVPEARVRTYYIFFPDPWPKQRHHKHRLFNDPFLRALHRTLAPGGAWHFATDHWPYFREVVAALHGDPRFQPTEPFLPDEAERTDFELLFSHQAPIARASYRRV